MSMHIYWRACERNAFKKSTTVLNMGQAVFDLSRWRGVFQALLTFGWLRIFPVIAGGAVGRLGQKRGSNHRLALPAATQLIAFGARGSGQHPADQAKSFCDKRGKHPVYQAKQPSLGSDHKLARAVATGFDDLARGPR
jgi:hypothetical protein